MASNTIIDLPQMIDVACGSPHTGIINFNALHALLHVIVQQMRLETKRVEYQGSENDTLHHAIASSSSRPLFEVTEFSTKPDQASGNYPHRVKKERPDGQKVDTIIVVKKKEVKVKTSESGQPKPPIDVPTTEDFRDIGDESSIDDKIEPLLPKSSQLLETLGEEEPSQVSDMYTMLNMTKRLEAAEITIKKLISMLGEMGREYSRVNSLVELNARGDDLSSIKDQMDNLQQKIHKIDSLQIDSEPIYEFPSVGTTNKQPVVNKETKIIVPKSVPKLPNNKEELDSLKSDLDYMKVAVQRIAMCSGQKDIANFLMKDLKNVACMGVADGVETGLDQNSKFRDEDDDAKLMALEKNFEMMERRMITADKRVYDLEKEFGEISDRIEDVLQSVEATTNQDHDTASLYAQLNELKSKAAHNGDRCTALMQARDTMLLALDDQKTKLKFMDELKIDREEVDELLAEKADYNLVQRKVSMDHFDATKRELGNGLQEALTKLSDQEDSIKEQIETLREDLTCKLDRADLETVRELFMSKIHNLQDRIKAMTVSRKDPEAAATKTKFLRDVQCLSCEQKVIMRKEEPSNIGKGDQMVAMKSMKPQLTYDLDNIRRELNQTGTSRNMHHFELMYRNAAGNKTENNTHPCNRYCGGSHTAITAQENFQKRNLQKKRCCPIKEDNLIRGTDGTLYKGSAFEPCICAEGPIPTDNVRPVTPQAVSSKPADNQADISQTASNRAVSIAKSVTETVSKNPSATSKSIVFELN